jgi:hypothetical protein
VREVIYLEGDGFFLDGGLVWAISFVNFGSIKIDSILFSILKKEF